VFVFLYGSFCELPLTISVALHLHTCCSLGAARYCTVAGSGTQGLTGAKGYEKLTLRAKYC
jgi:hypothetical protein